ncbi:hypothetical protein HAX54_013158 [Datura stramonium]|uniref:Uncharacterized protein n=1 Tax=Datura stramonium TaxID=4076 RepID=A0ABS8Y5G2_DATST|nr:hypothetical protein [Datura stramonium]
MVEVGSEREKNRENNGGLTSMDSIESRWVFQDEYDSDMDSGDHGTADGDDGSTPRNGLELDSDDDDDNAVRKLIRTGPRIDSFDVDALEVPGAQRNDFDRENSSSLDEHPFMVLQAEEEMEVGGLNIEHVIPLNSAGELERNQGLIP